MPNTEERIIQRETEYRDPDYEWIKFKKDEEARRRASTEEHISQHKEVVAMNKDNDNGAMENMRRTRLVQVRQAILDVTNRLNVLAATNVANKKASELVDLEVAIMRARKQQAALENEYHELLASFAEDYAEEGKA